MWDLLQDGWHLLSINGRAKCYCLLLELRPPTTPSYSSTWTLATEDKVIEIEAREALAPSLHS